MTKDEMMRCGIQAVLTKTSLPAEYLTNVELPQRPVEPVT
jgi:hypothetical protein